MQRIIVVCAGGHGAVVADILHRARAEGSDLEPIGFVDDTPALLGTVVEDVPVLGPIDSLRDFAHDAVVIAMGENAVRRELTDRLVGQGERLATAVHPRSVIASSVRLEEGVVVSAGAVVQSRSRIGRCAVINTRSSVDHDSTIEAFAHLSAGVTVGANVHIGEEALLALGASVISRRRIGARTLIGAGAIVVRDIPSDVIAFGNPARVRPGRP
jgi:sugar O-acyltransferase (sialic acid O-acetyltransferase NeuD family)